MSSRAAAGRKRLQPLQDPLPTSHKTPAKGLFSRAKRTVPSSPSKLQEVTASPTSAGSTSWPYPQNDPSENTRDYPLREFSAPHKRGDSPAPLASPRHDVRYRRPATSPGNGLSEKAISSQFPFPPSNDFGLLEATYQPPPPSKNSRVSTARAHSRPLRIQPAGPVPIYSDNSPTLSEVHLESPENSAISQSLLLHASPPLTELPAYAPISPNMPLVRPTLQIDATNLYSANMRSDNGSPATRWGSDPSLLFPSPPSSNPCYSPSRSRLESPSLPSLVTPQDDGNSYPPLSNSSGAPSLHTFGQSRRANASDSAISTRSGDFSKSPIVESPKASKTSSPTFIFPVSRSLARPKSTPKLNGQKVNIRHLRRDSFGQTLSPISPTSSQSPTNNYPPRTQRVSMSSSSSQSINSSRTGSSDSFSQSDNVRGQLSSAIVPESPAPFFYPSARTRAHPGVRPAAKFKFKTQTKKQFDEADHRSRFMGIPFKKKSKPVTPTSPLAFEPLSVSAYSPSEGPTITEDMSALGTRSQDSRQEEYIVVQNHASDLEQKAERDRRIKSRIGNYPLDPYDSVLLDNDRQTGELLYRLNPTGSPSFHNYGNTPPLAVLDLGCGQGHWVVDAAIAWKGYGTKVTGYDMVDISKGLLPWAVKHGVKNNIKFVRGNFLKQRLPFSDNTFDLVRMSCLTLCITSDAWVFVFQEVCRVLSPGGRLELIDDSIFFPYGKASPSPDNILPIPPTRRLDADAPQLSVSIPSSVFSTFSIYDSNSSNPGLGFAEGEVDDDDAYYGLDQVDEESDTDDAATLNGRDEMPAADRDSPSPRATPVPRRQARTAQLGRNRDSWAHHAAITLDLESLFEHMLTHKFGISIYPEEFVLDLMKEVFGYAEQISTMHLTLASPDSAADDVGVRGRSGEAHRSTSKLEVLSQSPGLMLWPSTFIPMQQSELEIHASKHLRMLLSCKNLLVEHAIEATDDEEIDEESVLEALYEYEGFLRQRFNPPPLEFGVGGRDESPASDSASQRGSVFSVSSEYQDAMWEYQSELRQRFAWPGDLRPDSPRMARLQGTPTFHTSIPSSSSGTLPLMNPGTNINSSHPDNSRTPTPRHSSNGSPPYSREEMTHARTFHVYEAIKLDESVLGTAI